MADVTITWRGDDFLRACLPAFNKGLFAAATVGAAKASEFVSAKAYPPASTPGEPPARETGVLERSIAAVSPDKLGTPLHAFYGATTKYARKLEFGGVIRAKKGRFLIVPVDRALARRVIRAGGTDLRNNAYLQFIPSKKGGGVLVLKESIRVYRGASTKGVLPGTAKAGSVVFVLKKQVTIQPRPYMARSAQEAAPAMREQFVRVAREELVKSGKASFA